VLSGSAEIQILFCVMAAKICDFFIFNQGTRGIKKAKKPVNALIDIADKAMYDAKTHQHFKYTEISLKINRHQISMNKPIA